VKNPGIRLIGLVGGVAAGLMVVGTAWAQVPNVTIGTNPAGTVFYAVGSGIAKVASESGKVKVSIQPYTGSSTFIPLLNSGELDFGMVNAVDMALAYRGPNFKVGGRNPFPYAPNLRLVMRGSPLMVGLLVRKDSPIKTIGDVKGKRLTGEYPAQLAVWYNMFGHLASAGLTWNDVRIVPVPAVNDGVDALLQGRADVSQHALNSAKVREADATVGVRHLSNDCSPDGDRRVRAAVPGYYSQVVKAGGAAAVIEDGCYIAYDIYFGAGQNTADAAVEATLRAIWENVEKLAPIHPVLREWTREKAVDPDVTIPYHPGAIRFYKERGVWKSGMDQVQQKLLATKP
jgi:TRAP transporter TAXI family solute receptor